MQVGIIGGICLLAFLLSEGSAEELDNLQEPKVLQDIDSVKEAPNDLKNEISLDESLSDSRTGEGSDDNTQSESEDRSFVGPAFSIAVAQTNGEGYASADSESKASAIAKVLPFNTFNEELGLYKQPGSISSQAETQSIRGGTYSQGINSYPYALSYPHSSVSSLDQSQANNGLYQPSHNLNPQARSGFYQRDPVYSPYYGLGSVQVQNQANNGLFQQEYNGLPNVSPYNQGSGFPQRHQSDSESHEPIIELISMLPKPDRRINSVPDSLSTFSSSYPYMSISSFSSANTEFKDNNEPYQPIPIPNSDPSPYDRFLVPYEEPKSAKTQSGFASYNSYDRNEAIPLPDPNPSPYDSFLVPYKDPGLSHKQTVINEYQLKPIPNPKPEKSISRLYSDSSYSAGDYPSSHSLRSAKQELSEERESYQAIPEGNPKPYDSYIVSGIALSSSKKQINNEVHQPSPIPNYESSKVHPQDLNFNKIDFTKHNENNANDYQPVSNVYDFKTETTMFSSPALSREYNENDDGVSSVNLETENRWGLVSNNPFPPNVPNPKLSPSGSDTAQGFSDSMAAADGAVKLYNMGIRSSSEPSNRPGGYKPVEKEVQEQSNDFPSGQISPIAFEDAESKPILPFEYIFPNKVPGGENTIRCTKENEFHHFWSKELSCLICICLNDYGVLSPVCASCGGCRTSPLRPPEPVPQLPDPTPEPPAPGPYPVYPEYIPTTSVPETFPTTVMTLPPQPEHAQCTPLPTGQPFTNPLHPCQICICRENYVKGKTEVQIECKDNSQCVSPDEVTALPPIPDEPLPVRLPICEKFPEHILFPHPTDRCKLCKCSKSLLKDGNLEQQITCYPHPDCVPTPEAGNETVPLPPLPFNPYTEKPSLPPRPPPIEPQRVPTEPIPALPEIVTVEPLPWPPITTTPAGPLLPHLTPQPGPLPGPSPHESCQPYPPNQTFQHPWDECQVCICTEATDVGMVTVEVNCYTKPSCCIEIPVSARPGLPGNLLLSLGNTRQLANTAAISDTASQPITSTYKSPAAYPSYGSTLINVYAGAKKVGDSLNQPANPVYPGFVGSTNNYPYQSGYPHRYVNTQFSEHPAISPVQPGIDDTIGQYKSNNFGYPSNYKYAQGDAIGGTHPLHGHYHQYDPSFQSVPPLGYPRMYQRPYVIPQHRDSYVIPPVSTLRGPNPPYMAPTYK